MGITFCCDTLGYDDLIVLKTIAPFVESGAYIEMLGSDGYSINAFSSMQSPFLNSQRHFSPPLPRYVVTCDWVKDYEGGIAVLGVTQNLMTAQRIMQEEIETEKREYLD